MIKNARLRARVGAGAGAGLGLGIEAVVSFALLDDPTFALCLGCLVALLLLLDISTKSKYKYSSSYIFSFIVIIQNNQRFDLMAKSFSR